MSLINKMLQDLDARRAAHGVGANLPNDVRPLPTPRASRVPIVLGALVVLVITGSLIFYQWQTMQEAVQLAVPAVVAPVVVAEVSPPPSPAPTPVEAVVTEPAPTIETETQATPSLQDLGGSLRMADVISLPDETKAAGKTAVAEMAPAKQASSEKMSAPDRDNPKDKERGKDKAVAEARESSLSKASPATAPADVLPQNAAGSPKAARIEKTDSVGSPRERADAEYRKAIAAVNQGRVTEALDGLRNVLQQDSYHVASRQLLVKLLLEARQSDEAVQVLHDGLQGQPAQTGWAMSLARLQVDRGDLAGAWQTLNYSSPAAGNNADYQGFSAHVLQRLGRNKEAVAHYEQAARLAPGDGRWWLGLGLATEAEGRTAEARDAFLRARQSGNLSAELMALVEQKLRQ